MRDISQKKNKKTHISRKKLILLTLIENTLTNIGR